jgi:hypothetical protein
VHDDDHRAGRAQGVGREAQGGREVGDRADQDREVDDARGGDAAGLGGMGGEQPGMAHAFGAAQQRAQPLGVGEVLGHEQHLERALRVAADLVEVRFLEDAPHVRQLGQAEHSRRGYHARIR